MAELLHLTMLDLIKWPLRVYFFTLSYSILYRIAENAMKIPNFFVCVLYLCPCHFHLMALIKKIITELNQKLWDTASTKTTVY